MMTKLDMNTPCIAALQSLGKPRLAVVGDLMLDRQVSGVVEGISPESPVLNLRAIQSEARPGGAAAVGVLLAQLGAEVSLMGVVGDDPQGCRLKHLLRRSGIGSANVIVDPGRPTTLKERFLSGGPRAMQHLLRVDRESREELPPAIAVSLCRRGRRQLRKCGAMVVSDYGKGACSPGVLQELLSAARKLALPVIVDPANGVPPDRYAGASLLVPNRRKYEQLTAEKVKSPDDVVRGCRTLCRQFDFASVLVTLDRDGMVWVPAHGEELKLPARAASVVDVTGASDTVMALLGVCVASSIELPVACQLAAVGAGLQVGRPGVVPIQRCELLDAMRSPRGSAAKVLGLDELSRQVRLQRAQGRSVVVSNGCFDLLHTGHVAHLEEAAALADLLVVAVNSDASVRRLKGPARPVVREADRARLLAALRCVDYVVVFEEDTPNELLRRLQPDVLAKGGDYGIGDVVGREVVEEYGGRVQVTSMVCGRSTTSTIHSVHRQQRVLESHSPGNCDGSLLKPSTPAVPAGQPSSSSP